MATPQRLIVTHHDNPCPNAFDFSYACVALKGTVIRDANFTIFDTPIRRLNIAARQKDVEEFRVPCRNSVDNWTIIGHGIIDRSLVCIQIAAFRPLRDPILAR